MISAVKHPQPEASVDAPTEDRHPGTLGLDSMSTLELLETLNDEDARVAPAVRNVLPELARAVDLAVGRIRGGGVVHYFGAGTSGRLAVLDAAELMPTFNAPVGLFVAHHAGGVAALVTAIENVEDSAEVGAQDACGLYGAALGGVPEELSEAARVDGASHWQTFRSIVFPLLVPAIGTVSVLTFIFAMEAFALPYALGGSTGNPAGATEFISLLFYRTAFENGSTNAIGSSSAIATLLFLVIFGGAVVATRVLRRHQDRVGA